MERTGAQQTPAGGRKGDRPSGWAGTPAVAWPPWTGPAALLFGLLLAAIAGLVVDIPALALGVSLTTSHIPGGLEIADTVVQDCAFVAAAIFFAQLGGRRIDAAQFGLRATRYWRLARRQATPLKRVLTRLKDARLVLGVFTSFIVLSAVWAEVQHAGKEKLLEQLGAGESTSLLLLSAALTCVVAPICEELLFRGFIFNALRNWRGTWPAAILTGLVFGVVHAGSAPAVDLVPLAALGLGLCLLYERTGSLYPCIGLHALNNSVAFASLESWSWQGPVLIVASLGLIGLLALVLMRVGVIAPEEPPAPPPEPSPDRLAVGFGGYDG